MNSQVREASRGKVSAVKMGLGGDGGAHCSVGINTVFQACAERALYVKGTCFLGGLGYAQGPLGGLRTFVIPSRTGLQKALPPIHKLAHIRGRESKRVEERERPRLRLMTKIRLIETYSLPGYSAWVSGGPGPTCCGRSSRPGPAEHHGHHSHAGFLHSPGAQ